MATNQNFTKVTKYNFEPNCNNVGGSRSSSINASALCTIFTLEKRETSVGMHVCTNVYQRIGLSFCHVHSLHRD